MNQLIHDRTDYRRLAELYEEFDELWTRLQAFYLDAVAGFRFVASYVQAEQGEARSFVQGSDMDLVGPGRTDFQLRSNLFGWLLHFWIRSRHAGSGESQKRRGRLQFHHSW